MHQLTNPQALHALTASHSEQLAHSGRSPRGARRAALAAIIALAAIPGSALAMPATGPEPATTEAGEVTAPPIIRETDASTGETTAALVLSGAALILAAGGVGYTATTRRRATRLIPGS
jgi:hypothetical protein